MVLDYMKILMDFKIVEINDSLEQSFNALLFMMVLMVWKCIGKCLLAGLLFSVSC